MCCFCLPACRLRVHGLIVGSPEQRRADPAVLRGLCSHTLPSGKNEVGLVGRLSWAAVVVPGCMAGRVVGQVCLGSHTLPSGKNEVR